MVTVAINPKVLRWAIDRSGLATSELQKSFPKLESWLDGNAQPSMRQLEGFARRTLTPLGFLFLPEPPQEEVLPIVDFRTTADEPVKKPSAELLSTIYEAQRRQNWMHEYLQSQGAEPLKFVGSVNMTTNSVDAANRIRFDLGLSQGWTLEQKDWEQAYATLRTAAEDAGVMVSINSIVGLNTHRSLNVDEFRGFVLIDPLAPLVFINSADAKSAQMFTLAHELAHVWMGKEGVLDMDVLSSELESKCNAIAAELLVDRDAFAKEWYARKFDFDGLAKRFKVSSIVIARRALELDYITRAQFMEFYLECLNRWRKLREADESVGGPDFYKAHAIRVGRRFAKALVSAAEGRLITLNQAFRLTGLKGKTFFNFANELRETQS